MTPVSCLLIGAESLLVGCGDMLRDRGHDIHGVVTANPVICDWADRAGIPVASSLRDIPGLIGARGVDWLFSIANLTVIPDDILAMPRQGAINFHDGPLPGYAGLNTPVWALLNGEPAHAITWHLIGQGIDTGDILDCRAVPVAPDDTAFSLNSKCYGAGLEGFAAVLSQLEAGALARRPQDTAGRRYFGKTRRPPAAGRISFTRPAEEIARLVRALDFGGYWNPLCCPKIEVAGRVLLVGRAALAEGGAQAAPGTILDSKAGQISVATAMGAVVLSEITDTMGRPVTIGQIAPTGTVLASPDPAHAEALRAEAEAAAAVEGHWRDRLQGFVPAKLALARGGGQGDWCQSTLDVPHGVDGPTLMAALVAWALHNTGDWAAGIAYASSATLQAACAFPGYFSPWVPLSLQMEAAADVPLTDLAASIGSDVALADDRGGFAADLVARDPAIPGAGTPAIGIGRDPAPIAGTVLTLVPGAGGTVDLWHDAAALPAEALDLLVQRLEAFLRNLVRADALQRPVRDLLDLPQRERDRLIVDWNQTRAAVPGPQTLHAAFEAQADRTPEATALVFDDQHLSYAELDASANRLAHGLIAAGARPGDRIGLCLHRSPELIVGALAILKAGGAYVPLDPAYPADRIAHYVTDSAVRLIVTQAGLAASLPGAAQTVLIDAAPGPTGAGRPAVPLPPEALAYVIYTSGSTGRPKGVMVEHRNVTNFFTGMDALIDADRGGVWLAVTSLGFDISVLELFYTLARGFKVVLVSDENRAVLSNTRIAVSDRKIAFGLYYWGNDDGAGPKKYELLLEGAKFADAHGFNSVWTPERHFHAFGGPYPNPSVTGAAVAAVTSRIAIRAGSCVAPLHHPARIAEDWAVIDNLCNGRAGLGMASGWQPDDFVLRPENTPPHNKAALFETLDQVRRLWRGEAVEFPTQSGEMFAVRTQPRPVSAELPVWVTTAGNPDTWREAGRIGANVLTHLLGQSVEEVGEKIKLYHNALREAGHDPDDHTVTLMLHTYLAEDRETAAKVARAPMKDYLRSAAGLIKQYAWAFPAFKKPEGVNSPFEMDLRDLGGEELEAILDFAFERYFEDSGLFGTVEDAVARAEQLKRIGVDEIACLIDYGIPSDLVLEGLKPLAEALRRANEPTRPAEDDFSIAAQIIRHDVTHLQCTPSMARLIAADEQAAMALRPLRQILLGGEALEAGLADRIEGCTNGEILNMYGPTETTIWSTAHRVTRTGTGIVSIGKPLANTTVYVLDDAQRPVPIGLPGELYIGGLGVAPGYWQRDDLTAERFLPDPFAAENGVAAHGAARMYRTGDLVRWRPDGTLDFLGRTDHQLKIRGQRIELGEIEARIGEFPNVRQTVVVPRATAAGEPRLVAYLETSGPVDPAALRADLAAHLPEVMVPSMVMQLDRLPLTPNRKIDRAALPEPVEERRVLPDSAADRPQSDLEQSISAIWSRVLGVSQIRADDSFFALGGHSLLAVQAHKEIRALPGMEKAAITDIFRFPVLRDLAGHLGDAAGAPDRPVPDAPAMDREQTISKRRAMRARRTAPAG